ncbi:MerR family transcriptional regulator [Gordonia sp. NPDC003376]
MRLTIADAAARSGIPATTLRFYESIGLLTPRRAHNGYRTFDSRDLERLGLITSAKSLGLELPEIKTLLTLADTGTCTDTRQSLKPLLRQQIADVEQRIAGLAELRDHLRGAYEHVADCPDSPEPCMSECAFRTCADAPDPN